MNDTDKIRKILAGELGVMEEALPIPVVVKAMTDPLYLHHLITCKADDFMMRILTDEATNYSTSSGSSTIENTVLFKNAAAAALKWLISGAKLASESEYKSRINACRSCPHISLAPSTYLYRLIKSQLICSLCGCDIEIKAKILTEQCPDKQYSQNGRWIWK
jgi:hypothetical protein